MKRAAVVLALTASVLLRLDPPALVIYLEQPVPAWPADRIAEAAACGYVRAVGVPLPVPYILRRFTTTGEGGRYVPDPNWQHRGMLTRCP